MGATSSTQTPTTLHTSRGTLKGLAQHSTETGRHICTRYAGIPYALPPVGERRWKRPVPLPEDFVFSSSRVEGEGGATGAGDDSRDADSRKDDDDALSKHHDATSSRDITGDYTAFGALSPQPDYAHGSVALQNDGAAPEPARVQSEDCLYVNVWVPGGEPPAGGWPVQFFIHGGWLQVGDAMQTNTYDPFDSITAFPRIIVSPTYRLNLFGFLSCAELAAEHGDQAPGNYGFWDQRAALEWTATNIALFGGDPANISVGGLSAGAYSTIFQLHYDVHRSRPQDRLIKRVYLYSNAVGIQPMRVASTESEAQFDELCNALQIDGEARLEQLRKVPADKLVAAITKLKHHTFRAGTDDDFVSSNFLASIHDGSFATRLADANISIMLGEVANEEMLYRLVNPARDYEDLILQINNYYPNPVVTALLRIYEKPSLEASASQWRDLGARIVADCQVHAMIRGFAHCLLQPPEREGIRAVPMKKLHRYKISWRAEALDEWLDPAVGLCHGCDMSLWWQSGRRAGWTEEDVAIAEGFLAPFHAFLNGDDVEWGTKDEMEIRELCADGQVRVVEDDFWKRGMEIWGTMRNAQL